MLAVRGLVAFAVAALGSCTAPARSERPPPTTAPHATAVNDDVHAPDRYIVRMEEPQGLTLRDGARWNDAIAATQREVIACASLSPGQVLRRSRAIPTLHVQVDAATRGRLQSCPGVLAITPDRASSPNLGQSIPLIEATDAGSGAGYGRGQQVAIPDTGWFASVSALVTTGFRTYGTKVAAIAAGRAGVASYASLRIDEILSDDRPEATNGGTGQHRSAAFDTDLDEGLDHAATAVPGGKDGASVERSVGRATTFSATRTTGLAAAFSTLVEGTVDTLGRYSAPDADAVCDADGLRDTAVLAVGGGPDTGGDGAPDGQDTGGDAANCGNYGQGGRGGGGVPAPVELGALARPRRGEGMERAAPAKLGS
jgi:hypothetical protein